jgi:hypothetical protein
MRKRIAALAVGIVLAVGAAGISWSQTTIPPRTLTKKRIVIQNIHRCQEDSSVLVGRGDWDGQKKKWTKYVCRQR